MVVLWIETGHAIGDEVLNTYFNHVLELWLSTCNVLLMATGADILAVKCSSSWEVNRIEEMQDENLLVIVYSKMCMLK